MFYLSRLRSPAITRNLIFISNMKRTSTQAELDKHKINEDSSGDEDQSHEDDNSLEPAMKRAKMPKKGKHRMRAHINPMGDLTIPV
jgi:hypothetical protein